MPDNSKNLSLGPACVSARLAYMRVRLAFVTMTSLTIVATPATAQYVDFRVHRVDVPDERGDGKSLYLFGPPLRFPGSIDWSYNDAGRPGTLPKSIVIDELQSSTAKWTNACGVVYNYLGETSVAMGASGSGNPYDSVNVVGWGAIAPGVTGQTTTYGNNVLLDSDVVLDPSNLTTLGALTYTAVHEFGHMLGLAHSNVENQVMSGPAGSGNPGVPATTYTGQGNPQPDDVQGCICLYGPGPSTANQGFFCRDASLAGSLPSFKDFGSVPLGTISAPFTVTLTNHASAGSVTIKGISTTDAAYVSTVGAAGTCTAGKTLAPGGSCTFDLTFSPTGYPGSHNGNFVQITTDVLGPYKFPVAGTGTAAALSISASSVNFGNLNVGETSVAHTVILSNSGNGGTINITNLTISDFDPEDFNRAGTCSIGSALGANQSCSVQLTFSPTATGTRRAALDIATDVGNQLVFLYGSGNTPGSAAGVIEFYHQALNHYFISINAQEVYDLDYGVHPGWTRTGERFNAYPGPTVATNPVCRFYIPPANGDSHFFSASPQECGDTHTKFPGFDYESTNVFYIGLPDTTTGACPPNTVPVYRVWDNRADSNHRYTTSIVIRDQMVAQGGIAEGYGPNNVIMCAAP